MTAEAHVHKWQQVPQFYDFEKDRERCWCGLVREKDRGFAALLALLVAWSAIVFMFGYVVGQSPT